MGRKAREWLENCPGTGLNNLRGSPVLQPLSGVTSKSFPSSPDELVAAWSQAAEGGCCLAPEIVKTGRRLISGTGHPSKTRISRQISRWLPQEGSRI